MKFRFFILILLLNYQGIFAQKIDSLRQILQNPAIKDTTRILVLTELAIEYRNTKSDTTLVLGMQALALAEKINYIKGKGKANRVIGIYHLVKGDYRLALKAYQKALNYIKQTNDAKDIAWTYVNIGTIHRNEGNQPEALNHYFRALKSFESIKEKKGIGWVYNNIGEIYKTQFNYEKALEYHFKSLKIREEVKDLQDIALSYVNIGGIYQIQNQYEKALEFLLKGLKIRQDLDDKMGILFSYTSLSNIYTAQKKYPESLVYLKKGLEITQKLNKKEAVPEFYTAFAKYELATQNYAEAFEYAQTALQSAQKMGNVEYIQNAAQQYSIAAQKLGKYQEAFVGLSLYKQMSDSIQNSTNQKKALQQEYEYREEKQNLEQERKNLSHKIEFERQRLLFYFSLGGFILMLGVAFFAFWAFNVKKKANTLLSEQQKAIVSQNEVLQIQRDEILTQNEELQQKQDEILAQRELIEQHNRALLSQNTQIQSSIKVAQIIQTAILPFENRMQTLLKDYFLLFRPRDVVSGDFYWLSKLKNKTFVAVVDCTGHGVPGAFMSMIGHTSLDRIVDIRQIEEPAQILEELHKDIVYLLKQDQNSNNNGMDVALLCMETIENQQFRITFAGAKRPLYYIQPQSADLQKVKGTRKSIGGIQNEQISFEQTEIILPKGSKLYVGTDGYEDQNDYHRKRFGENRLQDLLSSTCNLDMKTQRDVLEDTLEEYQTRTQQRDDILLMGICLE